MAANTRRRRLTALTVGLLALGAVPEMVEAQPRTDQGTMAAPRRAVGRKWLPVWRQQGHESDTLFGFVREHLVLDARVHVLDAGTLQLHTFNANTGAHVWSAGSKGRGPAQMLRPVDLAGGPGNSVYVLDPDNSRISRFSASGQPLPAITNKWLALGQALCVMADGGIIVHLASSYAYLLELDAQGKEVKGWAVPWPTPDRDNTFLTGGGALRGKPTNQCVFYSTFGYGLLFVNKNRTLRTVPYIEKVALPTFVQQKMPNGRSATVVSTGENAGLGGSVWGDTLMVHFKGNTGETVVDLYHRNGAYIASMPTPPEDRLFYADRRLYGLSSNDATQKLRLWVDASDTATVLVEMGLRPARRATPKGAPRADTVERRPPLAGGPPRAPR